MYSKPKDTEKIDKTEQNKQRKDYSDNENDNNAIYDGTKKSEKKSTGNSTEEPANNGEKSDDSKNHNPNGNFLYFCTEKVE